MLSKVGEFRILILTMLACILLYSVISASDLKLGPIMVKQIAARSSSLLSNYTIALNNKALVLLNVERYNDSLIYSTKALAIDPNNIHVLINKAVALLNLGKYDESLIYLTKALAIDSNDTFALNNKAVALLNLGRNNESLIYLTKALAIDPNDTHALISCCIYTD
jgi:tetratricopeptide (TPR) repeat protein